MNFRFTAFLYVGVVALVGTLLVVNLLSDPPRPDAGLVDPLALVPPEEIDRVEIARTQPVAETLVFAKTAGGKWDIVEPFTARADGAVLDSLVRELYRAKPVVAKGLTSNLKLHGLDDPVRVTLKKGDAASATVAVGDTTVGGPSAVTFVLTADRPKTPVAVRTAALKSLFREAAAGTDGPAAVLTKRANDFRRPQLFSVSAQTQGSDLSGVKLTQGTAVLALTRTPKGAWTFAAPAGYGEADARGDDKAGPDAVTGVMQLLAALDGFRPVALSDYIENVPAADLPKYGLGPNDPVLRIEVTPKEGTADVVFVGKKAEGVGPPKFYCRVDGDPAVVPIPTDKKDALARVTTDPAPLRNRDLIEPARRDTIDALDVTVGSTTLKLRKTGTDAARPWTAYGGPNDPTPARAGLVDELVGALCARRAALGVLVAPNDAAFVPLEVKAKVVAYFGAVPPGPADKSPGGPQLGGRPDAPPVTLTFGMVVPAGVHVRRKIGDGPETDFILPVAATDAPTTFQLAIRPRLEYIDPNVGSFAATAVQQFTVKRGAETVFDVSFAEAGTLSATDKGWFPAGKWTVAAPAALAGKPANRAEVDRILNLLAGLGTAKLHAEAPAAPDLALWKLTPPLLTATVALKGGDPAKPKVFEFGDFTPTGDLAYVRIDGKPFVLTASKFVRTSLETADLRDPVVHRVDRAKIERLDLIWKTVGNQNEILLVKPDAKDKWVAIDPPPGFTLDPAKVEELVKQLEVPRNGVLVAGPEKPEYQVNGEKFRAIIRLSEGGKFVDFNIGAEDGGGFVYARSNETPGVAKLPAEKLRPFIAIRAGLAK